MQQMQQMSQMYPQMANPGFSQPDTSAQIAELQMKLYSLQQQAAAKDQMQQMQAYHQFQTPMMNMGQPGMFQPNMMAQQVPLD